jgi:hypothetical protein
MCNEAQLDLGWMDEYLWCRWKAWNMFNMTLIVDYLCLATISQSRQYLFDIVTASLLCWPVKQTLHLRLHLVSLPTMEMPSKLSCPEGAITSS